MPRDLHADGLGRTLGDTLALMGEDRLVPLLPLGREPLEGCGVALGALAHVSLHEAGTNWA